MNPLPELPCQSVYVLLLEFFRRMKREDKDFNYQLQSNVSSSYRAVIFLDINAPNVLTVFTYWDDSNEGAYLYSVSGTNPKVVEAVRRVLSENWKRILDYRDSL